MEVKGIKRGKIIELLQEIDLPDGVEITVEVKLQLNQSYSNGVRVSSLAKNSKDN